MSNIKLITVSDDRQGRKGGLYAETQNNIAALFGGWIHQRHWHIYDIIDCDPLMQNINAARNGRVYKPYVIRETLATMNEGDFLIYNDCSPEMWPEGIDLSLYDLEVIKALTIKNHDILVAFVKWDDKFIEPGGLGIHTHHNFTLDNCISLMAGENYRHSFLCASGMICIRKTGAMVKLVEKWLIWNRYKECSCMRLDEHEDSYYTPGKFSKLGNRHDQSVLSLLLNKENYDYCDIVYNDLNPYNFLNFCLPGHDYKFINSNTK